MIKTIDFSDKKAVMKEITAFEKEAVNALIETACVITRNGEVYKCYGVVDAVYPDYDLGEKLIGAIVSHNHPTTHTTYSFSSTDLQIFTEYNLEILRGVDVKYKYEFNKNSKKIDEPPEDWWDVTATQHSINIRDAKVYGIGYRRWKNDE